jgi:hypothetical protein
MFIYAIFVHIHDKAVDHSALVKQEMASRGDRQQRVADVTGSAESPPSHVILR